VTASAFHRRDSESVEERGDYFGFRLTANPGYSLARYPGLNGSRNFGKGCFRWKEYKLFVESRQGMSG
jgi:hypothetical protein